MLGSTINLSKSLNRIKVKQILEHYHGICPLLFDDKYVLVMFSHSCMQIMSI